MMKLILLAMLALAPMRAAAADAEQFNLMCDVVELSPRGGATSVRMFSVDLAAMKYCDTNACSSTVSPISGVTDEGIQFITYEKDDLFSYLNVSRYSGAFYESGNLVAGLRITRQGHCEKRPFTPLPAKKF